MSRAESLSDGDPVFESQVKGGSGSDAETSIEYDEGDDEGDDESDDDLDISESSLPSNLPSPIDQAQRVLSALGLEIFADMEPYELFLKIGMLSNENQEALRNFRRQIQDGIKDGSLTEASMPIDAFLQKTTPEWDSHCHQIDTLWAQLVADVVALSDGEIHPKDLVKPTGTLCSPLAAVFHYPTYRTQHPEFGHVQDATNPCLRIHQDKFGLNGFVRTQDRIPLRNDFVPERRGGIKWAEKYSNWDKIEARFGKFNRELIAHSKVVVFAGRKNVAEWQHDIELEEGDRIQQVQFRGLAGPDKCIVKVPAHIFNKTTSFYMIKRASGEVKKLVFLVFHPHYILHINDYQRGAYTDMVWNAAASFACQTVARQDAYVRYTGTKAPRAKKPKPRVDDGERRFDCYYFDQDTGEQCLFHYATKNNLADHFRRVHGEDLWDPDHESIQTAGPAMAKISRSVRPKSPPPLKAPQPYKAFKKLEMLEFPCFHRDPETGKQCEFFFKQKDSLKQHVLECHNDATWESDAEDGSMVPVVGDMSEGLSTRVLPLARPEQTFRQTRNGAVPEDLSKPRLICYECGLSFSRTDNLRAHFTSKHKEETFDPELAEERIMTVAEFQKEKFAIADSDLAQADGPRGDAKASSRERSRKHYNSRQPMELVCTLCKTVVSITNGKKHFTRHHKRVAYKHSLFEKRPKTVQSQNNAGQAEPSETLDMADVEG